MRKHFMAILGGHSGRVAAGVAATLVAGSAAHAVTLPVTSGLIMHLDSSSVTTDGSGNVTQWNDQSGLGNHATQGDNTMQPTLEAAVTPTGEGVIRFDSQADATPEHLVIAGNSTDFDMSATTWFVVFRAQTDTNNRRMWTSAYLDVDPDPGNSILSSQALGSITDVSTSETDPGLGYRSLGRDAAGAFTATTTASAGGGTPSALNTTDFFVGSSYFDSSTDEIFAMLTAPDGTQYTDTQNGATEQLSGHLQTLIGAQTGNDLVIDANGWSGDIAAMVIYNRVLTPQEFADVTEALRLSYIGNVAPPLVGDLDDDGFVGIADLNIVLGNWNSNVTAGDELQGDPSGDGFVGIEDLNTVLGNWNAGTPPSGVAVPEPASLVLLGLGGLAALRRR
ncbi:MAG: PEP-CTERM sorting domain-containing protein [Phycisphaerales bacterium]